MMRVAITFEINQRISSTLSILLVLLLSTLVALLTLKAAREIINMTETSPVYNIEKRVGGGEALGGIGVPQ